ncbi:MAG: hypothetical protein NC311_09905 [Muribaculaceae bacterium]|nr:hypothetical protein [Muribaculaceae bacterium]
MSFSSLRSSSLLYILNREGVPSVNVGTIVNVSAPTPKWGAMAFGQQPEMLVDLTVKVDDKQGAFPKVPANLDVWEYEQNGVKTPYILATSRDAINAEINNLKQQAIGIINSVDYNRQVVKACDDMLKSLNPEFAEKQRQEQEIAELKLRLDTQQNQMAELIALLKSKEGKENAKEDKPSKNK